MWAGILIEEDKKNYENYIDKKQNIYKEVSNHFGGNLESTSVNKMFNIKYLLTFGTDLLTKKYGYCEKCTHYMGVKAIIRKLKNIPVINSYCKENARAVAPLNRCTKWEPAKFYQQLILYDLKVQYFNNIDTSDWWLCPKDNYNEDSY